jgi:hypothetical protein
MIGDKRDLIEKALVEVLGWSNAGPAGWYNEDNKYIACFFGDELISLKVALEVLESIRRSHKWCCIDLDSDYCYMWTLKLTPAQVFSSKIEIDPNYEHKPMITVQEEELEDLLFEALLAIQESQNACKTQP